jgi:hypothetical protein
MLHQRWRSPAGLRTDSRFRKKATAIGWYSAIVNPIRPFTKPEILGNIGATLDLER